MKLIIPDKFRGTLSADRAAQAIAMGLGGDCLCLPMADGGEGTAAALPDSRVVESAAVIGHTGALASLPILQRSSYTLGTEILRALEMYEGTICIAVGGTVTADGGAGLLQALGTRFYDSGDNCISGHLHPASISRIARADLSAVPLDILRKRLLVLSDVEAGLISGPLSALDFLKQKGATASDALIIKDALEHLHTMLGGTSPFDGAGGGVGYALAAVLGCRSTLGAAYVLDHLPVDWSQVSLVATGEGSIDRQSLGGKVVGCMLRKCEKLQIHAVAFGGRIAPEVSDTRCVQVTPPHSPLPSPEEAYSLLMQAAQKWAKKVGNFSL